MYLDLLKHFSLTFELLVAVVLLGQIQPWRKQENQKGVGSFYVIAYLPHGAGVKLWMEGEMGQCTHTFVPATALRGGNWKFSCLIHYPGGEKELMCTSLGIGELLS